MKITLFSTLAWSALVVCSAMAIDRQGNWPVRDEETVRKTLPLTEAPRRVVVDNVEGYIHVAGVAGSEVRITAHKTIRAETDGDLAEAKADVKLDITQKAGTVSVYYDAPWRCKGGDGPGCRGNYRHFYSVKYDIDVDVPADIRLVVSAVNNGDVHVDKISGDFEVNDINGGISMSAISGSGLVHTINGPVAVHFAKNPAGACSFKSINGALDAWFQPGLAADFSFKTFNGAVYSDFDVAPRPVPASAVSERRDGKFVYHSNGVSGGRTGNGGPQLSFDTLNGSIRLHQEK